MQVRYEVFRGSWTSWQDLFDEASSFATRLGPDRLIGMSHSESPHGEGVVTVWYWTGLPGEVDAVERREVAEEEIEKDSWQFPTTGDSFREKP